MCIRDSAYLVQNQQAVGSGILQNTCHFVHLHHKGGLPGGKVVRCAYPGIEDVYKRQVRNLAAKSAEASKSTSALIERSIHAVQNGTAMVNEAAESIRATADNASKAVELDVYKRQAPRPVPHLPEPAAPASTSP